MLERCRWVRVDSPRSIELNGQRITTRADGSFDWTPTDRQGLIPIAVGSGTLAFPSLAALNCEGSAPTQIQKISETGCANDLIRVIGTGLNRIQKILLDANAPLTFEFGSSLAGYWRLPENAAPGGHTLKLILEGGESLPWNKPIRIVRLTLEGQDKLDKGSTQTFRLRADADVVACAFTNSPAIKLSETTAALRAEKPREISVQAVASGAYTISANCMALESAPNPDAVSLIGQVKSGMAILAQIVSSKGFSQDGGLLCGWTILEGVPTYLETPVQPLGRVKITARDFFPTSLIDKNGRRGVVQKPSLDRILERVPSGFVQPHAN